MDWALYKFGCYVSDAAMSISEESCVWQVLWCVVLLLWVEQMLLLACPQELSNVGKSPITVTTKTEHRMGTRKHRSIGSRARPWIIHSSNASCRFHPLRLFRMLSVGDADRSAFKAVGSRPCRLWSPLLSLSFIQLGWALLWHPWGHRSNLLSSRGLLVRILVTPMNLEHMC